MTKVKDITKVLENLAPLHYQESYDNAGLLTGDPESGVRGVLVSLDMTEEVVDEAIANGCDMVVAHHPIIFKGLKKLTGSNYVERTVIKAIKNDIALYGIHTNLDNMSHGVNKKICDTLDLRDTSILAPKNQTLKKMVTFVPGDHTENVLGSLFEAGGGRIGNYKECSFKINGEGSFFPMEGSSPAIGSQGVRERVGEDRIEVVFPAYLEYKLIRKLRENHPYEEPAFDIFSLDNPNPYIGAGMIGYTDKPYPSRDYLYFVKEKLNLSVLKHTRIVKENINKVAVCGGAGSFLLKAAVASGADLFITADFKYHEYFDAENNIIVADVGHYESEVFTKDLIYDYLIENFSNIAVILAKTVTNPISYL